MKKRLVAFLFLLFLFVSTKLVYAGDGPTCCQTADCDSLGLSCTCEGAVWEDYGDEKGNQCRSEGHCYCASDGGTCIDWGGWSPCNNYCETRVCNTSLDFQIRSCGGGICSDATESEPPSCSPSAPRAPSYLYPDDAVFYNMNTPQAIDIGMSRPSSWGEECSCSASRRIKLCVSSEIGTTNPCKNIGTGMTRTVVASGGTAVAVFTPTTQGVYTWSGYSINRCSRGSSRRSPYRSFRVNLPPVIPTPIIIDPEVPDVPVPPQIVGEVEGNHTCQEDFIDNRRAIIRFTLREDMVEHIAAAGFRLVNNGTTFLTAMIRNPVTTAEYPPTPTPYSWEGIECSYDSDCGGGLGSCSTTGGWGICSNGDDCIVGEYCNDSCSAALTCNLSGGACTTDADCADQACAPTETGLCSAIPQATPTPMVGAHVNPAAEISLTGSGARFYEEPRITVMNPTDLRVELPIEFEGNLAGVNRMYRIELYGEDNEGAANWYDTGRDFTVWNCLVPVVGGLFDGSGVLGGPVCGPPSLGFSIRATQQANFTSMTYRNPSGDRQMTVPNWSSYSSDNANHLVWGQTYTPTFNDDLNATNPIMKVVSLSTGTTYCGLETVPATSAIVSPYSDNIRLMVTHSTIVNQEQWFQIKGGGVGARNQLIDNVPVTCPLSAGCTEAVTIQSGVGASDNGMVMAGDVNINSGCGGNCFAGIPRNWMAETPAIFDNYNYDYFYNKYYLKSSKGVVYKEDVDVGQINSDTGATGVVFVDGNLNIDEDVVMPPGQFLMINVNGAVTVGTNVNRVDGIILADGGVSTSGESDTQLVFNGILFAAGGNIRLNRSYINHSTNNSTPSVVVNYNPALIFRMPGEMVKVLTGWKEGL